ncbi:hypothetical protein GJ496_009796 [Pomphorhynchus laevis]|nr:hypothetical protein GJ496_009796 [Pomphorhynchus laevis]
MSNNAESPQNSGSSSDEFEPHQRCKSNRKEYIRKRPLQCEKCQSTKIKPITFSTFKSNIIKLVNNPKSINVSVEGDVHLNFSYIGIEDNPILAVEWLNSEHVMCICENSNYVYILKVGQRQNFKFHKTYKLLNKEVTVTSLSSNPYIAAVGCSTGEIVLIHLTELKPMSVVLRSHVSPCTAIDFCQMDSIYLCSGFTSGHIALFRVYEQSSIVTYLPVDVPVSAVKFLPASSSMVAISYHLIRELWIYNLFSNFNPVYKLDCYVITMQCTRHCPYLFCTFDEKLRHNEQSYVKALNCMRLSQSVSSSSLSGHICCLDVTELGDYIICASTVGDIYLIDTMKRTKKKFTLYRNQIGQVIYRLLYVKDKCLNENDEPFKTYFKVESIRQMRTDGHLRFTNNISIEDNCKNFALSDDRQMFLNSILHVRLCPGNKNLAIIGTYGGLLLLIDLHDHYNL